MWIRGQCLQDRDGAHAQGCSLAPDFSSCYSIQSSAVGHTFRSHSDPTGTPSQEKQLPGWTVYTCLSISWWSPRLLIAHLTSCSKPHGNPHVWCWTQPDGSWPPLPSLKSPSSQTVVSIALEGSSLSWFRPRCQRPCSRYLASPSLSYRPSSKQAHEPQPHECHPYVTSDAQQNRTIGQLF